jgi:hypothetical protein
MTDLDNVQEMDERKRTGMEPMSANEQRLWQSLEATVQKLGVSRTEALMHQILARAKGADAAEALVEALVDEGLEVEGVDFLIKCFNHVCTHGGVPDAVRRGRRRCSGARPALAPLPTPCGRVLFRHAWDARALHRSACPRAVLT